MHFLFFFFNDTATTEIYTLSLHDALPILEHARARGVEVWGDEYPYNTSGSDGRILLVPDWARSEEHTSELQSPCNLVCRLLLEKKKDDAISRALGNPRHNPLLTPRRLCPC